MGRLVLATIAVTLLLAAPASAKVWFAEMGDRALRWDQRVSTEILGCAGNDSCADVVDGKRVSIRRVGSRRATAVGRIVRSGALRFRVPHLRPGRYVLVADGRAVSGRFRIRAG